MPEPTPPASRTTQKPDRLGQARLTEGSTMRHVIGMTFAGSIGLIAVFLVDFLSLFYISLLKDEVLTAGIGYATTVLFLAISVNIGLMIASAALIARRLGAGDKDQARRVATSGIVLCALLGLVIAAAMLATLPRILDLLGAEGVPREVAQRFLWITLPSNPLMAMGMALSGALRAIGDARRAMMVTLIGGIATAFLDPFFIFALKLGTDGAALATVSSRITMLVIGWRGVVGHYQLMAPPSLADIKSHAAPLAQIAVPAVLTNIASPVAAAFMLSVVRQFGHEAVTASTIIDRLVPLAFGVIFALSGSIGPILAQNHGAGRHDRVRQALKDALVFALGYCLLVWAILALGRHSIPALFGASEKTAYFVSYFCLIGAASWVFNSLLFVANAAFNNLGFPLYSTVFNWGRATVGTMPFALLGAKYWGYEGVLSAIVVGWGVFGVAAVLTAFRAIGRLETALADKTAPK